MPGNILIIRIRSKNGVSRLQNLNTTSTFSDLKKAIADDTKIQISCLKILQGYPPTAMVHSDESITLSELSFKDGELLTIEESAEKLHTSPVLASCSSKLNSPESSKVSYEVLKSSSKHTRIIFYFKNLVIFNMNGNSKVMFFEKNNNRYFVF